MKLAAVARILLAVNLAVAATSVAIAPEVAAAAAPNQLWVWGTNYDGDNTGSGASSSAPVAVPGLTDVVQASAGAYHSLALRADGSVWAWGMNFHGELGNGSPSGGPGCRCLQTPAPVPGLSGVTAVFAGAGQSFALKAGGSLWAWGRNDSGELGLGSQVAAEPTPIQVTGIPPIQQVAAGGGHTLLLGADGSVWSAGINVFGELGYPSGNYVTSFQQVPGIAHGVSIAAFEASIVAEADGTVWAWGYNSFGEAGQPGGPNQHFSTPTQVPGFTTAVQVGMEETASFVLKADGTVWGMGASDRTGTPPGAGVTGSAKPVQIAVSQIVSISSGRATTLAARSGGGLWQWPVYPIYHPTRDALRGVTGASAGDSPRLALAPSQPSLSWNPPTPNLGYAAGGTTSAPQTITVTSSGTQAATISGRWLSGPNGGDFNVSSTDCTGTLVPGATCSLSATFTAGGSGVRLGRENLSTNAGFGTASIVIQGYGGSSASIQPPSLNFPNQAAGTTSAPQTVTVTATNPMVPLEIGNLSLYANGFHLVNDGCTGHTLANGVSCTVGVTFGLALAGSSSGSLYVGSNSATGLQVALTGNST